MFGFFASQEKKMRENARNWLELADKVYHYRRDLLTEAQVGELQSHIASLRAAVKEKAGAEKLKLGIESLEDVLRRTGGAIYPKTALVENVEFFLVAAIVILGIRTYFVQPFKIPTNSMWPTYNGMVPEVWQNPSDAPGLAMKGLRFLLFGAQHKEMVAPESGTVIVPVARGSGRIPYELKPAKTWLVLPAVNREYTFYVNESPVRLRVPEEFDFDLAFERATGWNAEKRAQLAEASTRRAAGGGVGGIALERPAEKGKPFLSFDIITGDQLFVDRMSYHFVRPKVGQGFVFRTDNIRSDQMRGANGEQLEQYYIKRLVGGPGDTLEIREPILYRNGAPIAGANAFSANAQRIDGYRGYVALGYLSAGRSVTLPPGQFYAMGDNSGNSADSRYWGSVPGKDVVGRPLFVYYPFTRHWGPAQ